MDPVNTGPVCFSKAEAQAESLVNALITKAFRIKMYAGQFCLLPVNVVDINERIDSSLEALFEIKENLKKHDDEKCIAKWKISLAEEEQNLEDIWQDAKTVFEGGKKPRSTRETDAQIDARQREELSQLLLVDVTFKR